MTVFGLSVGSSPRESVQRMASLATEAEILGFDALWVIDSQLVMRDVYVCLTMAAMATKRIKLGPGVTNPYTRHVTVSVNAMSTLNNVAEGRTMLGVGSGDSAVRPLGIKPGSIDTMRDWVCTARSLLHGEGMVVGGHTVGRRTDRLDIPIFLAASQPRMLQLAGELADGVIVMGIASPELVQTQLAHVQKGIESAGRNRSDILVDFWTTISVQDDEDKALRDVKSWVSGQARGLATWKEWPNGLERYQEEARRASAAYDFSEHLSVNAKHREVISDEFARFAAVAGNAHTCLHRLQELSNLGLDRMTLTLLSGGREDRLEKLGDLIGSVR